MAIIECVPNISEGRRPEVVARCVDACRVPGVAVLDHSSDASHHRSVITLAGDAAGLEQAVLGLYAAAVDATDLRTHSGEHPRMGAVDVVPFIPIDGVDMAACVALARRVGAQVAERFGVPVFLYEEAASSPARRNLEDIRRGEFEGLGKKMAAPEWAPDFGPAAPHASVDFNHDPHSAIIDGSQTRLAGQHMLNLLLWFDNEWGFANRLLDVACHWRQKIS